MSAPTWIGRWFGGHALLLIAFAATAHALVYIPFESHVMGDSPGYLATASALRHGGYTIPLRADAAPATGFSTHPGAAVDLTDHVLSPAALDTPERQVLRAPPYPAFLAVLGGGESGLSRGLVYVVQALLIGLAALLMGDLATRLWGRRVGIAAAGLFALDPFSKRYAGLLLSEALGAALAMLAVYAFVRGWQSRGLRWLAVAGLAGGLAVLTRPGLLPVVLVMAVAAVCATGARLRRLAALLVPCVLVVGPWLGWTAYATGSPVLQAYGQGVNMLVAARGQGPRRTIFTVVSTRTFEGDVLAATRTFPSDSQLAGDPSAHGRYLVRADRALRSRALRRYRNELASRPGDAVAAYTWRAQTLWMAHTDWYRPSRGPLLLALRLADWLVLLVIGVGVTLAARRGPCGVALGAMLLATTLALALGEADTRFTIPLRPLAFAFAGLAVVEGYGAATRLLATARTRTRPAVTS